MGERGPPPTPTSLLHLRGSWRAERNPQEPKPEPGRPRRPTWLLGEARAQWNALVSRLERMGVLSRVDGNALARYCVLYARWRKAEEFLQENGDAHLVKDREGNVRGVRTYPQVKTANHLAELLLRLEAHFGLTPASRTRLAVPSAPPAAQDHDKHRYLKLG